MARAGSLPPDGSDNPKKTFFSPRFGMVADRFGVSWMVYVAP